MQDTTLAATAGTMVTTGVSTALETDTADQETRHEAVQDIGQVNKLLENIVFKVTAGNHGSLETTVMKLFCF